MQSSTESDLQFQILLETAPVAIVVVNQSGAMEIVNKATEALFGYNRTELLHRPLEMLLPPRLRDVHHAHRDHYFVEPRVRSMGVGLDLAGLKKNGSEFPLEIGLSYVTMGDEVKAIAFVSDITARRHADDTQRRLRDELEQYAVSLEQRVQERTREIERRRAVAEGLGDILAVLNSNQPLHAMLAIMVAQAARLLDAPAAVLYERGIGDDLTIAAAYGVSNGVSGEAAEPVTSSVVKLVVQRGLPVAIADTLRHPTEEEPMPLTNGAESRALLAVPLIVNNAIYGALVLYYSIPYHVSEEEIELTVSFGRQAALAIENARLRQEVALNAVAAERSRLARDLHDSVTQTLFAASITADVLPRLWERSPAQGQERLQELRQLTRGALAEMRTLLYELRPQVLVRTPLRELLDQLGEALRGRAQIEVTVAGNLQGTVSPDVQTAFYRIAQEASNNISKHAQAHQATFLLESLTRPDGLRLTIQDDGIGFDSDHAPTTTLGLDIMRERADAIGASLSVTSKAGEGTTVSVEWTRSNDEYGA